MTSGGPAFSMSPLLHSNLQHLSLQLFCFPSSLVLFSYFDSSSFSSSSSSFGSLSPRCPATAVRVHHHGGADERGEPGKECVGEWQAFSLTASLLPLLPHIRLPCKVHSSVHRPCSPVTPCSLRFSMCHRGAAYMLWHCSTPTEDNMALQRATLY